MGLPLGKYYKAMLFGDISAADTWSINTWWHVTSFTTTPGQSDADGVASGLLADFNSTFWNPATNPFKALNCAGTNVRGVKTFYYVDGVLTFEGSATVTAVVGTNGNAMPAYCAQVWTLLTAGFGRSKRGRIYLPRTGVGMDASQLQYTLTQAHTDNLSSWLSNKTYNSGNVSIHSGVMSQTTSSFSDLVSIRTDSIPDTQRGRYSKSKASFTQTHSVS